MNKKLWGGFIGMLALSGCGGGGGSASVSNEPPASSSALLGGRLMEPVINGIEYRTATASGVTSSDGTFSYREGETISFYLGSTLIGDPILADSEVNFEQLFPSLASYNSFHDLKVLFSLPSSSTERLDFNRLHNSLVLLEAFDIDSDISNGVDFHAKIPELLRDVVFNVDGDLKVFVESDIPFRYFRELAQSESLIDAASITAPGMPLDAYYKSYLESRYFYLPVYVSSDIAADGVPERVDVYVYDSAGNKVRHASDISYDGNVGENLLGPVYKYNDFGKVLTVNDDLDADGINEFYAEYEYDLAGHLIQVRRDEDGDGVFDEVLEYSSNISVCRLNPEDFYSGGNVPSGCKYALDDEGKLVFIFSGSFPLQDIEYHSNSRISVIREYAVPGGAFTRLREFDDAGREILDERHSAFQYAPNGVRVQRWVREYDFSGNLVEYFYEDTGRINIHKIRVKYQYDGFGNLTAFDVDYYDDGVVGGRREYKYQENGLLEQEYWYELADGNGVRLDFPSYSVFYVYNEAGQVVEKYSEDHTYDVPDDPNGGKNLIFYEFDSQGNLINKRRGVEANSGFNHIESYQLEMTTWRAALELLYSANSYAKLPYEERNY
ncbi:hypothetical protein [Microbulbifer mangrovi]|uniref:hypothetical protein n=1 Tax=Microbulbifer mangrovi TaxID=927787 RepID=UPI001180771C|nr:hypothetical protein [Microbulbifer mangrovi]